MNGAYTPDNRKILSLEGAANEEHDNQTDEEVVEEPMMDYEYKPGEFVAVINEDDEDGNLEFWIARIKEVKESAESVAEELTVVWYETQDTNGRTKPIDKKYSIAKKRGKVW